MVPETSLYKDVTAYDWLLICRFRQSRRDVKNRNCLSFKIRVLCQHALFSIKNLCFGSINAVLVLSGMALTNMVYGIRSSR